MVILVVDDYVEGRQVLKVLLEMEGHTVHEAQNGLEAVDVATRVLPELILLDLNMPVMDGFTAARVLREQASTSTIRIVAISADGKDSESQDAGITQRL